MNTISRVSEVLKAREASGETGEKDSASEISRFQGKLIEGEEWAKLLTALAAAHQSLSRLVAPATPDTIEYAMINAKSIFRFLGPIPHIRTMILTAFICIIIIAFKSPIHTINAELAKLIAIAAAAGLGATFHALYEAIPYITKTAFNRQYGNKYFIRIILGVMAGIIMGVFVTVEGYAPVLLALLGGFSAEFVYRVLKRLINSVEALLGGDTEELISARAEKLMEENLKEIRKGKMNLMADLKNLQKQISSVVTSDPVNNEMQQIIIRLEATEFYES